MGEVAQSWDDQQVDSYTWEVALIPEGRVALIGGIALPDPAAADLVVTAAMNVTIPQGERNPPWPIIEIRKP